MSENVFSPENISLENISIAAPCNANWNEMSGNDQVRFCGQCKLNVYNLSGMSREAAESLVQEKQGQLCVRFFQRADGTLLTQNCPVGLRVLHRKRIVKALFGSVTRAGVGTAAAAIMLVTAVGLFTTTAQARDARELKGEMSVSPTQQQQQTSPPNTTAAPAPNDNNQIEMGKPQFNPPKDIAVPSQGSIKGPKPCGTKKPKATPPVPKKGG